VHDPILLRLLVCKNTGNAGSTGACPYPAHANKNATKKACLNSKADLAQIYFRHVNLKKARSCIVTFVEGITIDNTTMLYKIYQDTVNWLKIATERPYFFVVVYGDPMFYNDFTEAYIELEKKMKNLSGKEDLFFVVQYPEHKAKDLLVNHTTTKFTIRAAP